MVKQDYIEIYEKLIERGNKHNIRLLIQYLEEYVRYDVEYEFESEKDWDEEEDW